MADIYDVLSTELVPITYAGTDVRYGLDVLAQAKPSAVAFHFVIVILASSYDDPALFADAIDEVARPYAGYFNADVQVPGVRSISSYEDVDTEQQIHSRLLVTVESSNGLLTTQRDAPLTTAIPDRFAALVQQTQAALDAVANL